MTDNLKSETTTEHEEKEGTEDLHLVKQRIQNFEYEGETATVRSLRKEAQRTLDNQLEALYDIDSKAMAILRVNIVLIGLILSLVALAVDQDVFPITDFYNFYVFVGVVALLLSAMVAAVTYTSSDTEVGFSVETIHTVIDADLTEQEFEAGAANSYAHWIKFNDVTNIKNTPLITITSGLLVLGILSLALGLYSAIIDHQTTAVATLAYTLFIFMMYFTGIITQLKRWITLVNLRRQDSRFRK